MKISKSEEQALRITARLASTGGQSTRGELSGSEYLPEATVTKIFGRLRRGGLVQSLRGRNGGYALTRPAGDISIADVIRALGRPVLEGSDCSSSVPNDPNCPHAADCGLRSVWRHLNDKIVHVLERTSIDDLNRSERDVRIQMQHYETVAPDATTDDSTRS